MRCGTMRPVWWSLRTTRRRSPSIVRLLRDRALGRRLGRRGGQLMLQQFSLAQAVAQTEQLLERADVPSDGFYRAAAVCCASARRTLPAPADSVGGQAPTACCDAPLKTADPCGIAANSSIVQQTRTVALVTAH